MSHGSSGNVITGEDGVEGREKGEAGLVGRACCHCQLVVLINEAGPVIRPAIIAVLFRR